MMRISLHQAWKSTVATALLLVAGCTSTLVSLPVGPVPHYDETKPRHITAEASGMQLLLFFPILVNSRYDRAWEELKGHAGRDYITDVTVQDSWTYAFVGTVYTVRLEANAYPIITP
jgi:hypothetical protein